MNLKAAAAQKGRETGVYYDVYLDSIFLICLCMNRYLLSI